MVSVDRTLLGKLSHHERSVAAAPARRRRPHPARKVQQALVTCGDPGSKRGTCWNGSPYQPVPVATDVRQSVALRILEQPEDYPARRRPAAERALLPQPYGVNLADIVGYLSPITAGELKQATKDHDTSVNGASTVGRAGIEQEYDRYLRGRPGYQKVAVDSMGRVLGDEGQVDGHPGDTLVTSIDARVQTATEKALHHAITHRAGDVRPGHAPQLPRRLRGRDRAAGRHRPRRRDGQPADVRPERVGRRHHPQAAGRGSTRRGPATRFSRAPTRASSRPGSTWKPIMTVGAFNHGFGPSTRLDCSSGFQVGNRLFHNYESESLRDDRLRQGAPDLLRHVLLPRRLPLLAEVRQRPDQRERPRPAGRRGQGVRLRPADRHRRPGESSGPDRRPALEARLLEVDEGLLLRHRPAPAGRDQRLTSSCSPTSSASRAATTAPATP